MSRKPNRPSSGDSRNVVQPKTPAQAIEDRYINMSMSPTRHATPGAILLSYIVRRGQKRLCDVLTAVTLATFYCVHFPVKPAMSKIEAQALVPKCCSYKCPVWAGTLLHFDPPPKYLLRLRGNRHIDGGGRVELDSPDLRHLQRAHTG